MKHAVICPAVNICTAPLIFLHISKFILWYLKLTIAEQMRLFHNQDKQAFKVEQPTFKAGCFMMFLLQHDDVSLLLLHCDIAECCVEKIKWVLYSSLRALSCDTVRDRVKSTLIVDTNNDIMVKRLANQFHIYDSFLLIFIL